MLQPGQVINNTYSVIRPIGEGGGGVIFLAYHLNLQKNVVLKMIKSKVKDKIDVRGEVDILKNLKHTYLPRVTNFIEIDGDIFTVMDFIEGESFSQRLKAGKRFMQADVIKWAGQLCQALDYLHTQNPPIIHSDIKPGNIMLTPQGNICLIDFNISQLFNAEGTAVVGRTEGYAPPEQYVVFERPLDDNDETVLAGDYTATTETTLETVLNMRNSFSGSRLSGVVANLDARSDIYSLGATLYHILSGVKPGNSLEAVQPIEALVPDISDGLRYIINTSMEKDPQKRFRSAAAMLDAVNNITTLDKAYIDHRKKQKSIMTALKGMMAASVVVIALGVGMVIVDRKAAYPVLINQANRHVTAYDFENSEKIADWLDRIYPSAIGDDYVTMYSLYKYGNYSGAADYFNYNIANADITDSDTDVYADSLYVLGNSLIETENYGEARTAFENAITANSEKMEYYRDYAIACAKNGDFDQAYDVINTGIDKGLSQDSLKMIETEVAAEKGDYDTVYENVHKILDGDGEDSMKEHAVLTAAKAATKAGNNKFALEILVKAKDRLNRNNTLIIVEQLGQLYADLSGNGRNRDYTLKSIECFNELLDRGFERFYLMNNIAILYENINEFALADEMLNKMATVYPDDYRVYMQKTFLYIDMQSSYSVANRNYAKAWESYNRTLKLYENSSRYGNDSQMLVLGNLIKELKNNGWI